MMSPAHCRLLKLRAVLVAIVLATFLWPVINAHAYDTWQATRYADKWWNSRNPFFCQYLDKDCANFVSQCLIAGGLDLKEGPGYNLYQRHSIVRCGGPNPGLGEHLDSTQSAYVTRDTIKWHEKWHSISSPHPYPNDYDNTWTITEPGALKMKVHFSEFETEYYYDYVDIYDEWYYWTTKYTGDLGAFWSVSVDGETIRINLVTDWSDTAYGFDIDKYKYKPLPDAPSSLGPGDVIIFGDLNDIYRHAVIVVGGSGNNAYCNSHTENRWHRTWTDWVDGTLPIENPFTVVTFFEIPSSSGSKANLSHYTPSGWQGPLIPSSECGTHTEGPNFEPDVPMYIDWAIINDGYADLPDTIYYELYIDGWPVQRWYAPGLWYGRYNSVEDYVYAFSEGGHTLEIRADPDYYWDELSEGDNSFSDTWVWEETGVKDAACVTVTSPNGGEPWAIGSEHDITWCACAHTLGIPCPVDYVNIYYSTNGGGSYPYTINDTIYNTAEYELWYGSYSWTTPETPSTDCKVRIVATCGLLGDIDDSDYCFTIYADTTTPAAITDLTASLLKVPSDSGLVLEWSEVTTDVEGNPEQVAHYVIYRDTTHDYEPTSSESLASVPDTTYEYFDSGVVDQTGVNYYYVVKAVDYGANKSATSNMVGEFDKSLSDRGGEPPWPPPK